MGQYFGIKKDKGLVKLKGISMTNGDYVQIEKLPQYKVVIKDYGDLNMSNKNQFLQSSIKILVLGAKDWELGYSEEALDLVSEYNDIIYLFNFVDGRQYKQVIKSMIFGNCLRIPYEPDPFAKPKDKNSQEFFRELGALVAIKERYFEDEANALKKATI